MAEIDCFHVMDSLDDRIHFYGHLPASSVNLSSSEQSMLPVIVEIATKWQWNVPSNPRNHTDAMFHWMDGMTKMHSCLWSIRMWVSGLLMAMVIGCSCRHEHNSSDGQLYVMNAFESVHKPIQYFS